MRDWGEGHASQRLCQPASMVMDIHKIETGHGHVLLFTAPDRCFGWRVALDRWPTPPPQNKAHKVNTQPHTLERLRTCVSLECYDSIAMGWMDLEAPDSRHLTESDACLGIYYCQIAAPHWTEQIFRPIRTEMSIPVHKHYTEYVDQKRKTKALLGKAFLALLIGISFPSRPLPSSLFD